MEHIFSKTKIANKSLTKETTTLTHTHTFIHLLMCPSIYDLLCLSVSQYVTLWGFFSVAMLHRQLKYQ